MRKKITAIALVVLLIVLSSACASTSNNLGDDSSTSDSPSQSAQATPEPIQEASNKSMLEIVGDFENAGFAVDMEEKPFFQMVNAKDGVIFYIDGNPVKLYEFETDAAYEKGIEMMVVLGDMPKIGLVVLDTNSEIAQEVFLTGKTSTQIPPSPDTTSEPVVALEETPTPLPESTPTSEPSLKAEPTPNPSPAPTPKPTLNPMPKSTPTPTPNPTTTPINFTEWTPYNTSDMETLLRAIANGHVIYYNGQYWASPEYANMIANAEVVYENDVSEGTKSSDRYDMAEIILKDVPKEWVTEKDLSAEGITFSSYPLKGFYGGLMGSCLYSTPDAPDQIVSGTYNGITIKVEDGSPLFKQDDLISQGVLDKPITETIGVMP